MHMMCVCVCVFVCERECVTEKEKEKIVASIAILLPYSLQLWVLQSIYTERSNAMYLYVQRHTGLVETSYLAFSLP